MSTFEQIFNKAQYNAFTFLISEYSFERTAYNVTGNKDSMWQYGTVTYESLYSLDAPAKNLSFVTLRVAPLRLELDLDIGLSNYKADRYSIYELHQLECSGDFPPRKHGLYDAMNDVTKLTEVFNTLMDVLRKCGNRYFSFDNTLWDDLKNQRKREAQAYSDLTTSSDAEQAFKEKKWTTLVKLLESMEDRLSELQKARLKYAHKQLKTKQ